MGRAEVALAFKAATDAEASDAVLDDLLGGGPVDATALLKILRSGRLHPVTKLVHPPALHPRHQVSRPPRLHPHAPRPPSSIRIIGMKQTKLRDDDWTA